MSDEKTWLDEDGRHIHLAHYLGIWEGWNDLVIQIMEETGVGREEAGQIVLLCDARGLSASLHGAHQAFETMAGFFNGLSSSYGEMIRHLKDDAPQMKRQREIAERMLEIAEKQIDEIDDDSWKSGDSDA